jgi:hypothetical protein
MAKAGKLKKELKQICPVVINENTPSFIPSTKFLMRLAVLLKES